MPPRPAAMQSSWRILICKFKEFSRSIQGLNKKFSRSSKLKFTMYAWIYRKPKIPKTRQFLTFHDLFVWFSSNALLNIYLNYFCVVYWCEQSKQLTFTNFKDFDQFSRKNFHFQGVSSALEMTFQIPALSKDFKDLHKPWPWDAKCYPWAAGCQSFATPGHFQQFSTVALTL